MKRIPELDALRGLAAVTIVAYHLWFFDYGFLGTAVDLFFVVSGYLITTIMIRQGDRPGFLATFYGRRSLRIWPIYYLSLFAFLAINPYLPRPHPTGGLALYLTYTQNLPSLWGSAGPEFARCFHHTWSLAVEEQYYLIWPLIPVILGRRAMVPAASALIALAVVARMAGFSKWVLLTRCDALALGGLLAVLLAARGSGSIAPRVASRALLAALIGSVVYLAAGNRGLRMVSASFADPGSRLALLSLRMLAVNGLYFGLIGLVVVHSGHRLLAPLRLRWLATLGQMSYGLYLYHYILFDVIQDLADRHGFRDRAGLDAIKLAASFAVAAASWRLVERPLLSLKDRCTYDPSAAPARGMEAVVGRAEPAGSGAR